MNVVSDFPRYSEAELQRWLHVRAIEWCAWPVFLSQPLVPIVIIFYSPAAVLVAVVIADILWRFVRYPLASPRLASLGANFVILLKWPCTIAATIYLCIHQRYGLAFLAVVWPFVGSLASLPGTLFWSFASRPTQVGAIELQLAKRIGYVHPDATLFSPPIT
jgi:hypothetical protein